MTCPNCRGRDSSHWPFGPCTICGGTGQTTPEKAAQVVANRKTAARGPEGERDASA